jgi:hypothetical protein
MCRRKRDLRFINNDEVRYGKQRYVYFLVYVVHFPEGQLLRMTSSRHSADSTGAL